MRTVFSPMLTDMIAKLLSAHDLPEPPPADPMPVLMQWLEEAKASGKYDDPNAMTLATATRDGIPSARIVLCKSIEPGNSAEAGGSGRPAITFYTNYESRKGRELESNPRAATVFHWPHATRQARLEGVVERLSEADSDAYFRSRPLLSRVGAVVSRQSTPIASRSELVSRAMEVAQSAAAGGEIRRPAWWGGYRLVISAVELWSGRDGRLHQRVRWERRPNLAGWDAVLLSP